MEVPPKLASVSCVIARALLGALGQDGAKQLRQHSAQSFKSVRGGLLEAEYV